MTEKRSLNVLQPNDKVDELRRAFAADGAPTPADVLPIASTPLGDDQEAVRARVIETLETIYDPEIPVNIYDLGLIYAIDLDAASAVRIRMTLTAPACPVADAIVREVETKVRATPGVSASKVELVWQPAWDKSRMTEAALLELGLL